MNITKDIFYVGVNDLDIDLFEGQYVVPKGMSYNSYLIVDEKTAVFDTVDARFTDAWLANIRAVLGDRAPDYLIVQHMEPDHSANIANFLAAYPTATVVATARAFAMMGQFFGTDYADRRIVAAEGSTLNLGTHTLTFVTAPMVHWPEVMVTYDSTDRVLFSADGFGKFGAFDADEPWTDESRRYYIGIVGKYGMQVQALLKKASKLDIAMICRCTARCSARISANICASTIFGRRTRPNRTISASATPRSTATPKRLFCNWWKSCAKPARTSSFTILPVRI